MTNDTFRRINTELRDALSDGLEALQTGEAGFAMSALNSCERAALEAERANPEVCCLTKELISTLSGALRENFTL